MEQAITGTVFISNVDCPFSYQNETEQITIYTGRKTITIPDNMDTVIGQKNDVLSGGQILYKLSVPLSNNCLKIGNGQSKNVSIGNQIRTVDFFIDNYQENSQYTEMRLQFPELDCFIPSCSRANILDKEIVISKGTNTLSTFDFKYHGMDITTSFNANLNYRLGVRTSIETFSEIVLKFSATDDWDFLCGLYDVVKSFFSFICNRQNIGLRDAILVGIYPTKGLEGNKIVDVNRNTTQRIFFSQKYLEPEEENKQIAKTPRINLFLEKLPELFSMFSEESAESVAAVNRNGIHHSTKYRNLIDLEQSLHITSTFEYYVRELLPKMSSSSTIDFYNDLRTILNEYIEKNSGEKKHKAIKFQKSLSPQISLKDKIKKVYDGYSTWKPLKPILKEWFGDNISSVADAANLWRNELAHENRKYQPDYNTINAIRLIEHINYCIVFRQAGYNDDDIFSIIEEILVR